MRKIRSPYLAPYKITGFAQASSGKVAHEYAKEVLDLTSCNRSRQFEEEPNNFSSYIEDTYSQTLIMGVPFEALIPYGIMLGMFGLTGAGLSKIRHMQNGGKRGRHSIDQWDKQMMDRDLRLTGFLRGQTDNAKAPVGFEVNNPWKVESRFW